MFVCISIYSITTEKAASIGNIEFLTLAFKLCTVLSG